MRYFIHLLVMVFVSTCYGSLWAADSSQPVAMEGEMVSPTVLKIPSVHVPGTLVVARIDLTKMDAETTVTQLESLYAKWIESEELTSEQQTLIRQKWDAFVSQIGDNAPNALISEMLVTDPGAVVSDLGRATIAQIREVFGIDRMTLFIGPEEPMDGIAPVGIALHKAENPNLNRSLLAALTLSREFFVAEDTDTMAIFPCHTWRYSRRSMSQSEVGETQAMVFMLRSSFGAVPKRFVEALNAPELGDMAIQIVIDPVPCMKNTHFTRNFAETFGTPALRAAQSTRAISIGLDPNTLRCVVLCQTDKASSAKLVQAVLVEKCGKMFAGTNVTEADRKAFIERLLPQPEGTTVKIQIDPTFWDDVTVSRAWSTLIRQWCNEIVAGMNRDRSFTLCSNHLKQLILAMLCYYDTNRSFPPAYTVDTGGRPLHSWRVLVLPYLGQKTLYDQIRLDEPWDSEWNRQFHGQMPEIFRCGQAVVAGADPQSETVYSLITGPDSSPLPTPTVASRSDDHSNIDEDTNPSGVSMASITDGSSSTIAIAERKKPVCWMRPDDANISDAAAYEGINVADNGIGAHHGDGPQDQTPVAMYDGAVRSLPITLARDVLKAPITLSGGETLTIP
ncbi:MAG: DUF1559 domain-containing protein [Thermoguttaceae bacterium]|nr:DUF1559 domain-containing protein [Thermoguttaceae bacterium]